MKKLYQAVLVATVILGGVLLFSLWNAAPQTAEAFVESGKAHSDQGKHPEAIIQFLNAIQKDPRHREGRYLLAMSYRNVLDLGNAVKQLKALLEYYPDDVPANLQLGGILLTAGQANADSFREARAIAELVLAKEPNNVAALVLSGNASAGLQNYSASVDLFEKALILDPENANAFVSLGTSQALQKNFPAAEQAFLKARALQPKDKTVLISLGNYYRAAGDVTKADSVFKDALSFYPDDRVVYLQAVEFYMQTGRFEEAEKVLKQAQSKSAQDPIPSLVLVDLYTGRNQPTDARKLLAELKQKFPTSLEVAAKVAVDFLPDQPDKARQEIDQILKADPKNVLGSVLLGEHQFLTGQYEEAAATFGKDPAVNSPLPQPHFFLGNIAMRRGQIDQAIFHYQKSLELNFRYLPSRVALAEVFMNRGRLADSREELRRALELRPGFVPARILKTSLDVADKNYALAEQELNALLKELPENSSVYRQKALLDDARGRKQDTEKNLLRALDLSPSSQPLLRDLVVFYIRNNQADRALQRLQSITDDKKEAFHYELIGLAYSQGGKADEAEKAYKKAIEKEPGRGSADLLLLNQYITTGRMDDGLKHLDQILTKNPANSTAYMVKGTLYENQGKLDQAKQSYIEALKNDPNQEVAANNYAYILAEEGRDLQTALGYAQNARKKQPENPSIADTLGWVYYKLGSYVLAREQAQFAVSKQPDNGAFLYHLAMIYRETKQVREAEAALRKAVATPSDFKEKSLAQAALKEISK